MLWLDRLVVGVLAPLAMWVLASGLDDLFLDLCSIYFRLADWLRRPRGSSAPATKEDSAAHNAALPEKRIALLIPAWREDAVIAQMLEHNIAAIHYSNYEIFVGVYPNDTRTLSQVLACEKKHAQLHHVVCPHDGPTSKADCLNWVYQGVLLYETGAGSCFDVFLHHDAEDLIHPKSLGWINRYCEDYDMVQAPVFPLATPWWEFTHGAYCDEFAESHWKDLHTRQRLGGFLPSCGVGTAYRRRALDRLAWNNDDQVFRPGSLTEDYQMGLDLHRLGCSQVLLDAKRLSENRVWLATREYFPRRFWSAVRQKGRWAAGIALQSWQQFGWNAGEGQLYWLWRDRKGLVGNPATILANLIFLYGLGSWLWAQTAGEPWRLARLMPPLLWWILILNTVLIVVRQTSRALCVRSVYGWKHALASPLRSVWGNIINFAATLRALGLFAAALIQRQPPRWLKTDHSYPSRQTLMAHKRRLGEVLIELRVLPAPRVEQALRSLEAGERLGEHLVRKGVLSESDLYNALAAQQGLPFEPLEWQSLAPEALECLPRQFARRIQVIPVRVTPDKHLWVAGSDLPSDYTADSISRLTNLKPHFQLITPSNYRSLCEELDGARVAAGSRFA